MLRCHGYATAARTDAALVRSAFGGRQSNVNITKLEEVLLSFSFDKDVSSVLRRTLQRNGHRFGEGD